MRHNSGNSGRKAGRRSLAKSNTKNHLHATRARRPLAIEMLEDRWVLTSGPATQLVFTVQPPASFAAGSTFTVDVTVEDAAGATVTDFSGNLDISLLNNPTSAALFGTTNVAVVNGIAEFSDLSLHLAGTGYTLESTFSGLTSAVSTSFDVTAASATHLTVVSQPPSSVVANSPFGMEVAAEDDFGNIDTTFTNNVSLSFGNNPSSGVLNGTTDVAAVNGIVSYSGLSITKAGNGYTLTADSTGETGATTNAINVSAHAAATHLIVSTQPASPTTAGQAFDVKISAVDDFGNVDTDFTGNVNIALLNNPTSTTLGGTLTVSAVAGVADFSDLSLTKAGTGYTLQAEFTGLGTATTNAFNIVASTATQLVVTSEPPASVVANQPFTMQVTAEDDFGNTDTSATGNVLLAIANNPGTGNLHGTTTVALTGGVANFSGLSLDQAGAGYTLSATEGSLPVATTSGITVSAHQAATHLAVLVQPPTSTTAGASFDVKIAAEDDFGNIDTSFTGAVSIDLLNNPSGDSLGGTLTVNAVAGVADFSDLSLTSAATGYTLQATFTDLTSVVTNGFDVVPGEIAELDIIQQPPSSVVAGAPFELKIAAKDDFDNIVTSFTGSVSVALSANPGGSTLGGTTTLNAVNGVADFSNLTLNKAESAYLLQGSTEGLNLATTAAFDVVAAPATQLVVTTQPPTTVTAGSTFDVKVSAEDDFGNVDTTFNGAVTIAIANNPGSGTLGGTLTVNAVNGVADFSDLTLDKAGAGYTLQSTFTGLESATTDRIDVTAAAATHLAVTTQPPASVTAGNAFDVKVTAEDGFGNVDTTFTGAVTIAIANNPGSGTLGGTLTVNAVNGVADFSNLTLDKVGLGYTLQASFTGLTSATTNALDVTAAAATHLVVTTQPPTSVGAGGTFTVQISAEDQFGNVDTSYVTSMSIAIANNPSSGTLSGTLTVTPVDGVATFDDLSINNPGVGYTLQGSSSEFTPVTTAAMNVNTATKLVVTTQPPTSATAGNAFDVKISAEDADGNVDTSFNGAVTIAIANNPAGGTLGGTLTVNAVNGVADFSNLTLDKVGTGYTLQANFTGLTSATTNGVNVTAAAATQLVVTTQPPSSVTAGNAFDVKVTAEDQFGNVDTSFTGAVTIAIANNPAGGTLGGTLTVNAVNGVADFSTLTLNKAGTGYTLQATVSGLTSATTTALNVTAAAATQIAITTQPPGSVAAGAVFDVKVSAEDQFGNVDPTFTGPITIAIANNPGSGTLGGTLTVNAVAGVADFSTLTLNKSGTGYTLKATLTGLTPTATTSAFNVTAGTATQLVVTTQPPTTATAGSAFDIKISAEDQFGNVDPTFAGSVVIALAANPAGGTLGGTTTVTAVNGVADFSTLTLNKSGTGYTLKATFGSLTSATSNAISITAAAATHLVVTTQPPASIQAGSAFTVGILAEDQFGNVDLTYTGNVTIAIGTNPAGGTLGGTTTVAAVSGAATFSNLTLNNAGTGYTLTASSGSLTGATTTAINVTAVVSNGSISGIAYADIIANGVQDAGEPVLAGIIITLTGTDSQGKAIQSRTTKTASDGTYSFTGLPAGTYTLTKIQPSALIDAAPSAGTLGGTPSGNDVIAGIALPQSGSGTGYIFREAGLGAAQMTLEMFLNTTPPGQDLLNSYILSSTNYAPFAASALAVISQPPTSVGAGGTFDVKIAAVNSSGSIDTTFNGSVTMAIGNNPANGTLGGTTTLNFTNGVADFSNLTLNKAGTGYTLQAMSSGLTAVTTSSFNVAATTATQLTIQTQPPANAVLNGPFTVTVAATDQFGNVVTSFNGSAMVAIANNPASGTLGGTTTVNFTNGVATFSTLTLNAIGTGYTLQLTSSSLSSATTSAFNVVAHGTATQLVVTTQPPASVTAGSAFDVKITAEDAGGNIDTSFSGAVTIALAANPAGGTLGGTLTVNAVNGVADFSTLTLNKAGTGYTLQATFSGLTSATTSTVSVTKAATSQLSVTTQPPTSVNAGTAFDVKVAATDQFGNVDTTFTGAVTIALAANPGGDTLGGTLTVNAVNGVADFSTLVLNKAATGYTLQATTSGLTSVTTNTFNVVGTTATKLGITAQPPANVVANQPFDMQVAAEDQFGNVVTSFTGSVTVALGANPGGSTLGGTTTLNFTNGVADFSNLTLNNLGTGYTLTVTNATLTSATTNTFNVSTHGVASQLVATTQPPSSVAAGTTFDVKISAEDQFGNVDTSFTGAVTIALLANPGGGTLSGTLTVNAVNGVADFSTLSIDKLGSGYTLRATSTNLASATTSAFNITAGVATQLLATTQPPSSVDANTPFDVKISAADALGNVVTTFNGSVTIALANNPGEGTLGGTLTVNAVNGVADFSTLTINNVGTGYTLQATAGTLTSVTTSAFNVTAQSAATQLVVTTQPPASTPNGNAFAVQITAENALGVVDTSFNGAVSIALLNNPSGATLGGTLTVNAVNGVVNFSGLTIDKVGTGYTLQATFTGLTSATTNAFNVTAGAATQLAVSTQPPATVTAGSNFDVKIAAEDASGAVDTTFNGAVTIALLANPGSATLGGTLTVNAVNGVADFSDLSLTKAAEGYTLQATFTGLTPATTSEFTVEAAEATQVVLLTQPPSDVARNQPFGLEAAAEDQFGNVATTISANVQVTIVSNPNSAVLGGTTNLAFVNGVAQFSGLTLNAAGDGYTLQAVSGLLTNAVSSPINVASSASATKLVVSTAPPASVTAGASFDAQIWAEDQFGNVDTLFTGSISVAIAANPASGTLSGTTTVNAVNGLADFSNLAIDNAGTGYTLQFTSGTLDSVTTDPFNVTASTANPADGGSTGMLVSIGGGASLPAIEPAIAPISDEQPTADESDRNSLLASDTDGQIDEQGQAAASDTTAEMVAAGGSASFAVPAEVMPVTIPLVEFEIGGVTDSQLAAVNLAASIATATPTKGSATNGSSGTAAVDQAFADEESWIPSAGAILS